MRIKFPVPLTQVSETDRRVLVEHGFPHFRVDSAGVLRLAPHSGVRSITQQESVIEGESVYRVCVRYTDGAYCEIEFDEDGDLADFKRVQPNTLTKIYLDLMSNSPLAQA